MIQFDDHIFQPGWFNHQVDKKYTRTHVPRGPNSDCRTMVRMVIKLIWILYQRWDDDPKYKEIGAVEDMIFIDVYCILCKYPMNTDRCL